MTDECQKAAKDALTDNKYNQHNSGHESSHYIILQLTSHPRSHPMSSHHLIISHPIMSSTFVSSQESSAALLELSDLLLELRDLFVGTQRLCHVLRHQILFLGTSAAAVATAWDGPVGWLRGICMAYASEKIRYLHPFRC